jgi:uncharacterized protein (TIGR00369 family)
MTWYNNQAQQEVWAEVSIPEHFNSYPGFVHGGIVAALLDETAGRALLLDGDNDNLMVTARLEIKYLQPTPTNQPLKVIGRIIKQSKASAWVAGEIRLADGTVTATCKATIIRPPEEYYAMWNWEAEKQHWRVYDD